jgi:GAF domain-containing protein
MKTPLDSALADAQGIIADLKRQLAEGAAEREEALAQQTATAEVLGVINSSPGDLAPVFDAILGKAHTLCGAAKGALCLLEGEYFAAVATRGLSAEYAALLRAPQENPPGSPPARLLAGERLVHIEDFATIALPIPRASAEQEGARTVLFIPLRKEDALLGYITAYREQVRPFTDGQIVLLENFAAQAVIAMGNARLITEIREALEQQIATAEVLGVINSSPGDLAPVFAAILEKAHSLCGATFGALFTYDGDLLLPAALHNMPPRYSATLRQGWSPNRMSRFTRVLGGEPFVHIDDLSAFTPETPGDLLPTAAVQLGGIRTQLIVPLRKETTVLGVITADRDEVRPFADKQIALLQNFAAQAVIAMENARLLGELRQRTEEVGELNRDLEARVTAQVDELGRVKAEAVSRAAACRTHRLAERRENPGEPSPRNRRRVLRPARLHRLHRDRRARGGLGFPA